MRTLLLGSGAIPDRPIRGQPVRTRGRRTRTMSELAVRPDEGVSALFRSYRLGLLRFAARRVGWDAAQDVVGEVFATAWRRHQDIPTGKEKAWLLGVATGVIANHHRGT